LTRWVIAAPDEDREKVLREANKPDFQSLNVQFFPYSAVDELFGLVQRRKLTKASINDEFLNCFFEPCLTGALPSRTSTAALH
jgi:type II restriction enzyme